MLNGAFESAVLIKFEKDGKTPTKATIEALALKHIERYDGRIKQAPKVKSPPFVNVEQSKHLLSLWTGMRAKSYNHANFTPAELGELGDAIVDEG